MKTKLARIALVCFTAACISSAAYADDTLPLPQSVQDLKPVIHQEALPYAQGVKIGIPQNRVAPAPVKDKTVLRLAPGKSQTIALSRDAASVIVANPTNASVFLDNSRLLVIVPRAPGATGFTVLDREGKEILNQQIVVDQADDPTYVRVTRICGAIAQGSLSNSCIPSSVYFCPDNCVPVSVPVADASITAPVIPPISSVPSLPPIPGTTPPSMAPTPTPTPIPGTPTGIN